MAGAFFLALLSLYVGPAHSVQRIVLSPSTESISLGERFSYLEDRHAQWSLADVSSDQFVGRWRQSNHATPAFGFTDSAYWFTVEIENSNVLSTDRLLEVSYPILDSVDLYVSRDGKAAEHITLGDKQPFAQRPIAHRHFVFPISLSGQEQLTLYLRVQTTSALQVPASLWTERAFWKADERELLGQGIYFGIMFVMILYNLFLYTAIRDRSYIFYVLFVTCFTAFQLTIHGFSYQYLWPDLPFMNDKVLGFSVSAALALGGFFAISLLDLARRRTKLYRPIRWVALLAAVTAIASLMVPYSSAMMVSLGLSLIIVPLSFSAGIVSWRRGYAPARYYTIAWGALLLGALVLVPSKLGLIPRNFFTENAVQGGSAIEVILLSFALANRINVARREKDLAQAQAVAILQKYRTLYENAIEGIFQLTLGFDFVSVNRAMADMLGFEHPRALMSSDRVSLRQYFADPKDADNFVRLLDDKDEMIGYECRGQRTDGQEFWASLSVRTVYDDNDRPLHYEGSLVDITERRRAEEQIRLMAYYDGVTGLANRALLNEHVKHAIESAKRNKRPIALLFLDLDRFKLINDTLGHNAGDELLKEVASRLTECLREGDLIGRPQLPPSDTSQAGVGGHTVARLGGDEFVLALSEISHVEDAALVARRIGETLSRSFTVGGREVYITTSIGISTYPLDGEDMETLLKHADAAMYHAKRQGRNGYQFYAQSINAHAAKRLSLDTALRNALSNQQLALHYQPKLDLASGEITGTEALCRWQHPDKGMIPPDEFIPLAEESGLIVSLGEWVLRSACEQNKAWQNAGLPFMRVSVNLSARQFSEDTLPQTIGRILEETGLHPRYLELELTESVLMDDTHAIGRMLNELKEIGVQISIDDFGTGYSSLGYLKRLPVDALKIDRCFIRDIIDDTDNQAITAAILSMARSLKLKVVAEGVESREQWDYLYAAGCDELQGYFVSVPVPADEVTRVLEEHHLLALRETTESGRPAVDAGKSSGGYSLQSHDNN